MSKKKLIILALGVLLLAGFWIIKPYLEILYVVTFSQPELNTVYTKDFSFEKFAQVKNGMTKEEVENLLGQPFGLAMYDRENPDKNPKCYSYSKQKSLKDRTPPNQEDVNWRSVVVCYASDNKVSGKGDNVFFN